MASADRAGWRLWCYGATGGTGAIARVRTNMPTAARGCGHDERSVTRSMRTVARQPYHSDHERKERMTMAPQTAPVADGFRRASRRRRRAATGPGLRLRSLLWILTALLVFAAVWAGLHTTSPRQHEVQTVFGPITVTSLTGQPHLIGFFVAW